MEIQLLLPWNENRRQINEVWDTDRCRDQILPDGCKRRYYLDGTEFWYNQNGQLHRLDGPAIEQSNGTKYWLQNGKRHRLDGPAIEWSDGIKIWFIENKKYTEREFNAHLRTHKARPNT